MRMHDRADDGNRSNSVYSDDLPSRAFTEEIPRGVWKCLCYGQRPMPSMPSS
jgi:hypothetical protein